MVTRRELKVTATLLLSIPCTAAFQSAAAPSIHQRKQHNTLAFVRSRPQHPQPSDDLILFSRCSTQQMMQRSNGVEETAPTRRVEKLSAVSISDDWKTEDTVFSPDFLTSTVIPVLSASLMVTGNTVGAGMLVLPELAAGPGMAISSSIFVGAFLVNLVSGLLISEVAINQYSSSGDDVPSSFKEFAEVNLRSPVAANAISGISIFVNSLVMAFNTVKVGDLGSAMIDGMPSEVISLAWALSCLALVGSLGLNALSGISSVMVTGLFLSFAGLLLPGLANMPSDPMSVLMAPGTSPDVFGSALHLAPIVLMSLVYQNIVPTITKFLGYDRTKTTAAIVLGSSVPLAMYVAWAFAVVGGGIDMSAAGANGILMSIFSLTTIAGSSLGCIMSLSEEIETFLKSYGKNGAEPADSVSNESGAKKAAPVVAKSDDKLSLPAVVASTGCALLAAQFFSHDLNGALKIAGSFGSPLLYGILPVVMAQQQQEDKQKLPGIGLSLLGAASTGMVGNEIIQTMLSL